MKYLIIAFSLLVSTAAQADSNTWLRVYIEKIKQAEFAMRMGDNRAVCMNLNIARHAALNSRNEQVYREYKELMSNMYKNGWRCN